MTVPDKEAPLIDILAHALLIASPYALGRLRTMERGDGGYTPEQINMAKVDVAMIEDALARYRRQGK